MKILIDTNILISAFVFGGKPEKLLNRLLLENHSLLVTSYIHDEFRAIIRRKWPDKADIIYADFVSADFTCLKSSDARYGKLRDEKDIPVLSDAVYYNVDVILSGDKDFLEAGLGRPAVKSVSELWDFLGYDNS